MLTDSLEIKTLEQIKREFLDTHTELCPVNVQGEAAKPASAEQNTQCLNSQRKITRIPSVWKELMFLFVKIASIVLVLMLLFIFLYGIIRYNEPSMAPMIKDGDLVIFHRYTKRGYMPQDAVVLEFKGQRQVRRVVATAGDTVDITEQGLMINGSLQQEPDIYQKTERYENGVDFPLTVPEGQIFVLGDSRINATDSRIYGCVKIEDTLGKVMTVIRRRSI